MGDYWHEQSWRDHPYAVEIVDQHSGHFWLMPNVVLAVEPGIPIDGCDSCYVRLYGGYTLLIALPAADVIAKLKGAPDAHREAFKRDRRGGEANSWAWRLP